MTGLHSDSVDRLFETILMLKNKEECYSFFEDLCTVKEIQDMAQRLDTAFMLNSGVNYQTISDNVGISTATIGRVSRALKYGAGGYQTMLQRAAQKASENGISSETAKTSDSSKQQGKTKP